MHSKTFLTFATGVAMLTLTGCASKLAQPEQYSGFLKNYADLKEAKSASGKSELRWIDPNYNPANYDSIVFNPIIYSPVPKPNTQIGQDVLDKIRNYTNEQLKQALAEKRPLVTTPGPRSLIFHGAITAVDSSEEGMQFYEILPVAMIVAGTEVATGHRTMNTHLFFEGEMIDAQTGKPVIKVVRKNDGEDLANEKTPLTVDVLKKVIDDMAIDAVKFDPTQQ